MRSMSVPPKKKYQKNYLTQIIFQLQYNPNEKVNTVTMKRFKELLGAAYSKLETVAQRGAIIQNDGTDFKVEKEEKSVWRVVSNDKSHVIDVSTDSFAVSYTTYLTYREYGPVIANVQSKFIEAIEGLETANRIGLRYINTIIPNSKVDNWDEYINPKLASSLGLVEKSKLRRSMHSMVFQEDDETSINLNFGIFNKYFPAPIVDNEFIIDIDAFYPGEINTKDCDRLLKHYNKQIAIYFETSITDKLREEMGVIDEPE
jgi:uncharacterized protein (TIGR04255 family)